MTPMRAFWTLGLIFVIRGHLSIGSIGLLLSGLFSSGLFAQQAAQQLAQESPQKSDQAIISLLAGRCLECHGQSDPAGGLDLTSSGGLQRGSDSGDVLGKTWETGKLWEVISTEQMPPKVKLTNKEKELLGQWVSQGARLPAEPIDRLGISSDYRAGYDWWSLRELAPSPLPIRIGEVQPDIEEGWPVRNMVDSYVLAKLRSNGLKPNPGASPRSLLRRVFNDLIGLPPSFEQIEAFERNPSDEAYGVLVDELLNSPAYGERWGRHWLDVVRFGESDGFERNFPRLHSWPYRDWVIESLNQDMPYDRFVQMQIAGDQMQAGAAGIAAAGFLVSGVHNTVVGSSDRMKRIAVQDELEEKIGTMSQAFLGLTAQCARCHEHKFDPISSESYYRLAASLQGFSHGEREVIDEELERLERGLEIERARVLSELREFEQGAMEKASDAKLPAGGSIPLPVAAWDFESSGVGPAGAEKSDAQESNGRIFYDTVRGLAGHWRGDQQASRAGLGGGLVLDGRSYLETDPIDFGVEEKTLAAWVKIDPLDQSGGGVLSLQSLDGSVFDAIVYAERESRQWMAGSNGFVRSVSFGGQQESDPRVHIAIRYRADGTIEAFRNGLLYGRGYRRGLQRFEAGKSQFLFGLRHGPAGGNRWLTGVIYKAVCFDQALSDEAIGELAREPRLGWNLQEAWTKLGESFVKQRQAYRSELERIDRELVDLKASVRKKIYSVVSNPGVGPTKVLLRGDVYQEGAEVRSGGIDSVGGPRGDFGLAADASDAQRRVALAQWITQANRALLSRVIVNRVWHYHFGVGIVDTPNDLGFNGARPTHPELLDALAQAFLEDGMKLKSLHRRIVTSSVYRQSSRPGKDGLAKDSSNRLLWRYPVRRLDGESARDAMLMIAGVLDRTIGGPGYVDVDYKDTNGTTYYVPKSQEPPECFRRTVYRFNPRCERTSMLDVLDCPDPSATAPKRAMTTTPLQALSLLNSDFVFQMSDALVDRMEVSQQADTTISKLFRSVLLRDPTAEEQAQCQQLVAKHGIKALARALWNSSEFLVLD